MVGFSDRPTQGPVRGRVARGGDHGGSDGEPRPGGDDAELFAAVSHNLPVGARCAAGSTGQGSVSVALSDWDQIRLWEIEEHTRATDPEFLTRLDLAAVLRRRRRLRRVCRWLQALGAWTMLMGLSAAHGLISGGTLAAAGGCALLVWSALTARGLRGPTHPRR